MASVGQRHGCLCVLCIGIGEGGGGVVLGFHGRQAGPGEFVRFEVSFRASNRRFGRVKVRRLRSRGACGLRGGDGLASVAHFLHGRTGASSEAGNTDKKSKEAQHTVTRH